MKFRMWNEIWGEDKGKKCADKNHNDLHILPKKNHDFIFKEICLVEKKETVNLFDTDEQAGWMTVVSALELAWN